jgi:hypothetical protein
MGEWMHRATFFLISALVGVEWSVSRPGRVTPGEGSPGTHRIGGWVGPRAGLDEVEKRKFFTLPGFELRTLGRPVRSQPLYRLRYPGSIWYVFGHKKCIQYFVGKPKEKKLQSYRDLMTSYKKPTALTDMLLFVCFACGFRCIVIFFRGGGCNVTACVRNCKHRCLMLELRFNNSATFFLSR